jgi:hypothetical protein
VRRAPFRVLAHPPRYAPGADFYRLARRADWMAPVSPVLEPGVRYDCLLSDASTARSQSVRLHFDELSRDEQTGSVILLPKEPR